MLQCNATPPAAKPRRPDQLIEGKKKPWIKRWPQIAATSACVACDVDGSGGRG
jgi:hypothetical protein